MNADVFSEVFVNVDVLCLEFYNSYILAGIGNYLFIYDRQEIKFKLKIFDSERIHNINVYKGYTLLRGGKQVALGTISVDSHHVNCKIFYKMVCADWIFDIIFDVEKKYLILSTAHNNIEVWKIGSKNCIKAYGCEEKCLLYSSKFIGNTYEDFVLLCGTVFSEVIIWAPFTHSDEDQTVLERLKGHKGVIFSIAIDSTRKIICTTSDDRSLRIWTVDAEGPLTKRKHWKKARISLISTLYGHTARVWKSCVSSDCIVSAGEDSKLCIWSGHGRMENCFMLHQESGVRGLAVNSDTGSVIAGGEDGGIALLTRDKLRGNSRSIMVCHRPDGNTGHPRRVAFSRNGVICLTDKGRLLRSEHESANITIYEDGELSKCRHLELSPCERCVLVGMMDGRVLVIDVETDTLLFDGALIAGRLLSVHWTKECVVTCASDGAIGLHAFAFSPSFGFAGEETFSLPHSKERWTTCALICGNLLVLGDRMGSVHVYGRGSGEENPRQSFVRIHGYSGVTYLFGDRGTILSSGRDGTVRQFAVDKDTVTYSLSHKLPMEWAWKIVPYDGDYLVAGFASVMFSVWSLKKRELLLRYDCGGGHRSCDLRVVGNRLNLAYIRDKRVYLSEFTLHETFRVRNGFHGREINCLRILRTNPTIAISGGEDATVRIFRVAENALEQLFVLENHISSVRDIAIHSASETEKIAFSAGGRAQFVVHKFDATSLTYEETETLFLQQSARNATEPSPDGETRIMCVDSTTVEDCVLVCAGCSDFRILLFRYDGCLRPLTSVHYSHCILKIRFVRPKSRLALVSAGTDGRVVFWTISERESSVPLDVFEIGAIKIHQSGINSLHVEDLRDGKLLLVTGGDDNMLSATLLHFRGDEKFSVLHAWNSSTTHSCQITGIKVFENVMLSASIDQRLTVWLWSAERDIISVKFVGQYLTTVPDLQGLEASRDGNDSVSVYLYGKGLEVIQVDLGKTRNG